VVRFDLLEIMTYVHPASNKRMTRYRFQNLWTRVFI